MPCYKEDLEILRRTILAAYDAVLPAGCARTIYLCDDGKDPSQPPLSHGPPPLLPVEPLPHPRTIPQQIKMNLSLLTEPLQASLATVIGSEILTAFLIAFLGQAGMV